MTDLELAQIPSRRDERRLVWAARCVICRAWIRLATPTREATEALYRDAPPIHAECRGIPSARTPTLDGLES